MSREKIPISMLTMIIHETLSDGNVNPGRELVLKSYINQFDLTDEEYDKLMHLIDSYQLEADTDDDDDDADKKAKDEIVDLIDAFKSGMFKTFGVGLIIFGVYVLL